MRKSIQQGLKTPIKKCSKVLWTSTSSRHDSYEVSLIISSSAVGQIEILRLVLVKVGFREDEIFEFQEGPNARLAVYYPSIKKADALTKKIQKLSIGDIDVNVKCLASSDWQDKWKEDFKPFHLSKRFDIVPIWYKDSYTPKRRMPIYIDTTLAFGTGLHETTRFMGRLIERCYPRVESFLDIGTGTGILSIIALHCGIKTVRAMDISLDCIEAARKNFHNNGYDMIDLKTADIGKFKTNKQYDFVAANLVTHDLIKTGKKIVSLVKPGKYLAVSGISLENLKILKDAFQPFPLRCLKVEKGKKWTAVLYKKK